MRRLLSLVLTCAAVTAAPSSAQSAPVRDPATLLARFKAATGGSAWDGVSTLRTSGGLSVGGLDGTYDAVEDLRAGRSLVRFELKVARGQQGFDGEKPWEVTPNGEVLVKTSESDLEAARTEAYRTARAWWFPHRWPAQVRYDRSEELAGRAVHVVSIRPRGGREFELWLDAETSLPLRTVEQGAVEVITTSFSDWRGANGLRLPFRTVTSSGHGDAVVTIDEIQVQAEPVEAGAFAPPTGRPDDFTIAGGQTAVTVPFELLNNHIFVQARVNGGDLRRFLVDTGGVNLLTNDAAASLGIVPEGAVHIGGVGKEREQAGFARLETLSLGDITFQHPLFIVLPFAGIAESTGVAFDGLVGYELFQRFVVTIDYAAGQLTLTRPEAYAASAAAGGGISVPFRFDERHPIVDGTIDGIAATFTIDTGSRGALTLHRPFVEKHRLAERFRAGAETITGWGVGGPARGRRVGLRSLTLGAARIPAVATELSTQETGAMSNRYVGGNVGGGVLKRFTVTFDYARQLMILEPNGRPGDPPDRSGAWLNLVAGAFRVEAVTPGSPAAAAGLVVGDRVVAVDGASVSELRLADVRARLRGAPGTLLALTVESASGKRREARLTLRELD